MLQKLFNFFIGLILINFQIGYCILPVTSDLSEEGQALYKFLGQAGREIGEKYHMNPCGVGGGAKDGIWLMSLSFQRFGTMQDQSEARTLIVNCVIDLLDKINQDTNVRPFLRNYPFTEKNINLKIFNSTKKGYEVYDPFICSITSDEGAIRYRTNDVENIYKFKNSYEETFQEALAIVQNNKKNDLKVHSE